MQSNDSGTFLTDFSADPIDPAERTLRCEARAQKGASVRIERPKS
jgi:hypothetical protein